MVNSSILSWVVYENIQNQFEFVSNRLKEYCIRYFDSVMKTRAKFVRTWNSYKFAYGLYSYSARENKWNSWMKTTVIELCCCKVRIALVINICLLSSFSMQIYFVFSERWNRKLLLRNVLEFSIIPGKRSVYFTRSVSWGKRINATAATRIMSCKS